MNHSNPDRRLVYEIKYLRRVNEEQKGIIEQLSEEATKMARTNEELSQNQTKDQMISELRNKVERCIRFEVMQELRNFGMCNN